MKEKKYPCLGNLDISQVNSNGTKLFGSPVEAKTFIDIDFSTASIHFTKGIRNNLIMQDKTLYRISLSNEQWYNLLLNVNNDNGIPCTINRRLENGKLIKTDKPFYDNDYTEDKLSKEVFENLNKELKKIFPTFYSIKKNIKSIVYSDDDSEKRQALSILLLNLKEEYEKNGSKINIILNKYLNELNEDIDKKLINDIKSNFLGFSPIQDKNKALKLLNIINKEYISIENNNNDDNLKNEKVYNSFGVISIKTIKHEPGQFIQDEDAVNGIKITLNDAKIEYIKGNKIILPAKKLIEYEMSETQFSNFITSFSNGNGNVSTIKYRNDIGNIPTENLSLDKLKVITQELEKYLSKDLPILMENKINEIEPLLRKKIGKRKLRDMEIDFEQFHNYIVSNIPFHTKEIFEEKMKTNINKRQDIQISIIRMVEKLGIETLNEKMENNDFSDIIETIGNTKINRKQIKNKKDIIDIDIK